MRFTQSQKFIHCFRNYFVIYDDSIILNLCNFVRTRSFVTEMRFYRLPKTFIISCITSQNGQIRVKNLSATKIFIVEMMLFFLFSARIHAVVSLCLIYWHRFSWFLFLLMLFFNFDFFITYFLSSLVMKAPLLNRF